MPLSQIYGERLLKGLESSRDTKEGHRSQNILLLSLNGQRNDLSQVCSSEGIRKMMCGNRAARRPLQFSSNVRTRIMATVHRAQVQQGCPGPHCPIYLLPTATP
ncbi:unnamed protein product [Chrysodeixis includens]|uniref:Uncharacterized protein n=1 Tax=Chrysodeixis includens TaxID=689277 RepID=A0A9P0BUF0_CHRIL|nr:unnamed protein product [Chrysodeixis includens]